MQYSKRFFGAGWYVPVCVLLSGCRLYAESKEDSWSVWRLQVKAA